MCTVLGVGRNLIVGVKRGKVDSLGMTQGMSINSRVLGPV